MKPSTIDACSARRRSAALAALVAALLCRAGAGAQSPEVPREPLPIPQVPASPDVAPGAVSPPPASSGADVRPATSTAPAQADAGPLASLAWLEGCWQGTVNQRDFREQWLPLRGGMLIGAGQSVLRGKMQDYEYLRLEPRADGVYFTQFSADRNESSFKLAATTTDVKDTIFTFANTADAYPARLIYRRGIDGWLYETIEGPLNGSDKTVIYPLRRVDCENGEFILK